MPGQTPTAATIVVVDDDQDFLAAMRHVLQDSGCRMESFTSGEACLEGLSRVLPDVVCLDLSLPGIDGLETLERIKETHPLLPVIMLTASSAIENVVAAMQMGAYDYLSKPADRTRLDTVIRNAVERSRMVLLNTRLEREAGAVSYGKLIGRSPAMRELFRQMDRLVSSDITVLIHGESGTGKELVARALHDSSGRRRGPFVALNCAAIPETLQESELFGHERGSFTGATDRRIGKFEQAHRGTLFLDEVAELSPALQAKLLRALQSRSFQRVGGTQEIQSDFRLVAATHARLSELAKAGKFREDLFFRLAVFELDVPPLRDRREDVPSLAQHFVNMVSEREGRHPSLSPQTLQRLTAYNWPGNVRELENAMHRAVVAADGDVIRPDDLPAAIRGTTTARAATEERPSTSSTAANSAPAMLTTLNIDALEKAAILEALRQSNGNLTQAMKMLGIGRTTLYRKLKQYGLEPAALPENRQS